MIRFAVAGSLNYQTKINFLSKNGYKPELVIGAEPILDHKQFILEHGIELLVCFAYPNILTKDEIELFSKGCINYHSGLPKYRGRHPLNWMIIDGINKIPNAIHYIDEGIDTGDIILKKNIIRDRTDDYSSILNKQTLLSQELMLEAICLIEKNEVKREPQIKNELGYTRKRTPEDSKIDWSKSSFQVHNFVSALVDPMPNAYSTLNGKKIEIKKSYIGDDYGVVLDVLKNGKYIISTGDGVTLVESNIKLEIGDKLE
jgi:methionyl-tRNA formyltransferase